MESTGQSSDAAIGQSNIQSTGESSNAAVIGESSKASTEESGMAPESIDVMPGAISISSTEELCMVAAAESSISMLEGSSIAFPEESKIMSTGEPNVAIVGKSNLADMVVEERNIPECKPKIQLLYFPVLLCKKPSKFQID